MIQLTFFLDYWLDYVMNVVVNMLIHDRALVNHGKLLCGMMLFLSTNYPSAVKETYYGVVMLAHLTF